ncbi:MAG: nuclear transport factor 2 family protein [Alphaproteobacteria bacterium]|nr:nuclear transport factor 2 family protein [Alphaproteobacteria bacterium]
MRARLTAFVLLAASVAVPAHAQDARTPIDAVDAFHRALTQNNTAGALSLLARDLIVFEFGVVDPTLEQYAFAHMPFDMNIAAATQWKIETRRMGGGGDDWWVVTTYRVTGTDKQGRPIDNTTLETAVLRRTSGAFRIVHIHWSTNDPAFNAQVPGAAAR